MYKRWYDKYPELKSLLTILESIDKSAVDLIAQDFLQIILEKYGEDFDKVIKYMADNPPPRYSRWYDENDNLHTCVEFIKNLSDNDKKELVNYFIASLMSFVTNVDHE